MMDGVIKNEIQGFLARNKDFLVDEITKVGDPLLEAMYKRGLKCTGIQKHFEKLVKHHIDSHSDEIANSIIKSEKISNYIEDLIDKKINNSNNLIKGNNNGTSSKNSDASRGVQSDATSSI